MILHTFLQRFYTHLYIVQHPSLNSIVFQGDRTNQYLVADSLNIILQSIIINLIIIKKYYIL